MKSPPWGSISIPSDMHPWKGKFYAWQGQDSSPWLGPTVHAILVVSLPSVHLEPADLGVLLWMVFQCLSTHSGLQQLCQLV